MGGMTAGCLSGDEPEDEHKFSFVLDPELEPEPVPEAEHGLDPGLTGEVDGVGDAAMLGGAVVLEDAAACLVTGGGAKVAAGWEAGVMLVGEGVAIGIPRGMLICWCIESKRG